MVTEVRVAVIKRRMAAYREYLKEQLSEQLGSSSRGSSRVPAEHSLGELGYEAVCLLTLHR